MIIVAARHAVAGVGTITRIGFRIRKNLRFFIESGPFGIGVIEIIFVVVTTVEPIYDERFFFLGFYTAWIFSRDSFKVYITK